jgi:hypothetical protein
LVFKGDVTKEGSRIVALASTPGAAVGFTATLVIVDEWGEQDYAEELYSAYKPTIDMGGRLIGIGTGNNVGSFYHEIWSRARNGENGFHAHFLGWDLRPGRDKEWYDQIKSSYPSEQEFYRQYPANEVEAFIAAGGCPFKIDDINWYLETYVCPPLELKRLEDSYMSQKIIDEIKKGDLLVWQDAIPSQGYLVTYDPATGQEGGDYHAIHVIKLGAMEQVAEYRSRADTDLVCNLAWELARHYNSAEIVWERTGIGHAATNIFTRLGYQFLYEHEEIEQERAVRRGVIRSNAKKVLKLGWPSTRQNNHLRDADLIAAIRDHSLIIHSSRWFDEAKGFVLQADGAYAATGRAHDDLITSLGMGYCVALRKLNNKVFNARPIRSSKRRAFSRERFR